KPFIFWTPFVKRGFIMLKQERIFSETAATKLEAHYCLHIIVCYTLQISLNWRLTNHEKQPLIKSKAVCPHLLLATL
ncbi:hypothetical protein DVA81_19845, partial [Acinetobacter baumannii]